MTAVSAPPDAGTVASERVRHRRVGPAPYLLLVPAIAVLLVALGYPLVWQFVTSMQKFGLAQQFGKPPEFVGFDNYIKLFTDPQTWAVVARSIAFCLVNAAITVVVGVLVALLMNAVGKVTRLILQIALLLAWAMPVIAAMTVWDLGLRLAPRHRQLDA